MTPQIKQIRIEGLQKDIADLKAGISKFNQEVFLDYTGEEITLLKVPILGSVLISASGLVLTENIDYTIDNSNIYFNQVQNRQNIIIKYNYK